MIKPTILEIDNVRVIKWDENNYVVQREETYFSPINQMDVTSYVFKGCYATLQACFKAIHVKGLLIDENSRCGSIER
ncbi:hypothetical protein [Oceanobacillus caeni]|uniref:Uncharacterized protein n=1 Tax=Oceanobacillus caeni TaxID=405946 RepID=A0ABR5MK35_9BACI|nr:hypothetical protein [Oceanobacillus caeni]KPH76087.1 hypothetical protein AFL42_07250 [Oceanobacillus caeni]